MGRKLFTLGSLLTISNGKVKAGFEQSMKRIMHDCNDRPGVPDARKLVMTVMITPKQDESGDLENVILDFDFKETLPSRKTSGAVMNVTEAGNAVYDDLSPDDVDQGTLQFAGEEDEVGLDGLPITNQEGGEA